MFITKKYLSRRTLLRGMGVSISLPFLESMVPAQTALRKTAASPKSRLTCIYVPHGAIMDKWTPATEGTGFAFTEILKPLEPFRNYLNVVSDLAHPQAGGVDSDAGADHQRSAAVFLSGAHPEKGVEAHVGKTMDQVVAEKMGQDTPLPSLELSIEDVSLSCGAGLACAYMNTLAWKTATTPLPMENNPQVVFERLFGDGRNNAERNSRREQSSSILDSVKDEVTALNKKLPAADRTRLTEYLDDVREIERRIQKAGTAVPTDVTVPDAPVGIPDSFSDHLKLMFDLQVLAYKAEITRVSTLMYARDTSTVVYPDSGVRSGFHSTSHHSDVRENMERFAQINRYHASMLAYLLEKMKATPDGDGSLLDHSLVLYGSAMSDGNKHNHDPLPVLLAGGASGQLKGGRHLRYSKHTTMSNLLLAMVNKLGVPMENFGDSTGKLEI
ncbi:MAG: hypothetical protein JWO19_1305 [Bryobacterales bacterium]|nr:hypothetical protein [Bryobacterales bacterium]